MAPPSCALTTSGRRGLRVLSWGDPHAKTTKPRRITASGPHSCGTPRSHGLLGGVLDRFLGVAIVLLDFALHLLRSALDLLFRAVDHFARFLLHLACSFLQSAFDLIGVHSDSLSVDG